MMGVGNVLHAPFFLFIAASIAQLRDPQDPLIDPVTYKAACPDYKQYSAHRHPPESTGPLSLPYQRPSPHCRTFISPAADSLITNLSSRIADPDLARLFENAFPNTLDTTIRWHVDGSQPAPSPYPDHSQLHFFRDEASWTGPHTFIVTGDINAEWLRDSAHQLSPYHALATQDPALRTLILGAIATQAEFVLEAPYCNAFQPPPASGQTPAPGQVDAVRPVYEPRRVFECKWELDSVASFLALGNALHEKTGELDFVNERWVDAVRMVLAVLASQGEGTFNREYGRLERNPYSFRRLTESSTETLCLGGMGNPLNSGTGLVRSAFRPSDDATIFGFLIPANAMMAVELRRTAKVVRKKGGEGSEALAGKLEETSKEIEAGVWEHGVFEHPEFGKVFAYEVDGYGSRLFMDDANIPSLLSLPMLGFVSRDDPVYLNTRRMVLSRKGNPYYLTGPDFEGIGGPHVGLLHAWPMSVLVQAMTSNDEDEVRNCLEVVLQSCSSLGLVHEGVNVNAEMDFTRSWFAWANSVLGAAVLDAAERFPQVVFGKGAQAFRVGEWKMDGA